MRAVLLLVLVALPSAQADPRGDALAVVNAAIQAHGGQAALTKAATFQRHGTGTLLLPGARQEFADVVVAKLPGKLRVTLDIEKRVQVTMIADDKKGWKASGGTSIELTGDGLAELQEEAYVLWLTTLVPLAGDAFTLKPVGEAQRDGRAVVGVQVASKGHADATLWFDRASKLLVLIEKDANLGGAKVRKVYGYADHKEFAGVKLATRLSEKIGDRVVTQATVTDYRFPETLADTFFAKP